jgi:GAF domain-containing protein
MEKTDIIMEELKIPITVYKTEFYKYLIEQIKSIAGNEKNIIANMANVTAAIRQTFGFHWVGFYLCDSDCELVLGPFQGPIACTRIKFGCGVCGAAWKLQKTVIVPDVDKFPGHIACSSASKSEIVVPVFQAGKVFAVLDIDSDQLNTFDELDKISLEEIVEIMINA